MKTRFTGIIILTLLLGCCTLAWGATYYVDSQAGSDTNDGLSESTPLQTISKVNTLVLYPGDSVLFKSGEIWREQLIPQSGSAGSGYITYGAYGTGDLPKLLGSIQKISTSDWVDEGNNLWSVSPDWSAPSSQTKLLCHFNGTNGATNYTSDDANGRTATFSGSAQLSTAQKEFGSASILLASATSDYISFPDSDDFAFGSGDFCIDFWVRFSTIPATGSSMTVFSQLDNSYNGVSLGLHNSAGTYQWQFSESGYIGTVVYNTTISANTWYHIAIVRKNNSFVMFQSGKILGPILDLTGFSFPNVAHALYIGALNNGGAPGAFFNGYIDEFRIVKGASPFPVAGFIVPPKEYTLPAAAPQNLLVDVGNLIFNNEAIIGNKQRSKTACNTQGYFFYEFPTNKLYLYSIGNPATYYTNIECALKQNIIDATGVNYNIFDGLDLRYGAWLGIVFYGSAHSAVRNCHFSYIGGGDDKGDYRVRVGEAVNIYSNCNNLTIEKNYFDNIFWYCVNIEGDDTGCVFSNIYVKNNIAVNCDDFFSYYNIAGATASTDGIYVENNTSLNSGYDWGYNQTWIEPTYGVHLITWGNSGTCTNFFIRNNIFSVAKRYGIWFYEAGDVANFTVDYNEYYNDTIAGRLGDGTNYITLSSWQAASGQDAHSISANPLLTADYHLQSGSPAIKAGYNGVDIGAYPYTVAANQPPVANEKLFTINEDNSLIITLTGTDPENNPLTYSIVTPPAHGTLSGTAPNLIYTPNLNYNGNDVFSFKVNDGTSDSSPANIYITIIPVNHPPATPQGLTATAISQSQVNLSWIVANDPDVGDTVSYNIYRNGSSVPLNASLLMGTTYSDTGLSTGTTYSYQVGAVDNHGAASSKSSIVSATTLAQPNNPPIANNQSVTTAEDTAQSIILTASDQDGDTLTFAIVTQPAHGALSGAGAGANLTYTPNTNYNGTDSFTFKANDGKADSNIATVSITVTAVNDPPATPQGLKATAINQGQINLTWSASTDPDVGDTVTYNIYRNSSTTPLNATPITLTSYSDTGLQSGTTYSYQVEAVDNHGAVSSKSSSVSGTTSSIVTTPSAPANLTAAALSSKRIKLSWQDKSNNESGFKVMRSTNKVTFTQVAIVSANVTTYTNSSLNAGTTYYYKVYAYNSSGNSAYSNTAQARATR
ncbi:MAG: Ig-like domain-containing protein [Candidatus Omnitrophota bacterium]